MQSENDKLRKALIEMGRMLPGCVLADTVSSDFLTLLPEEMRAWKASLLASTPSVSAWEHILVPREPTKEMLQAGGRAVLAHAAYQPAANITTLARPAWDAMIAALTRPAEGEDRGDS